MANNAILRIEIHSSDFPDDPEAVRRAAFSGVDLTFDFGAVKFEGREFFLPLHLHLQYHIHLPDSEPHTTAAPSVLALTEAFRDYGGVSIRSTLGFDAAAPETAVHSTITFERIVPPGDRRRIDRLTENRYFTPTRCARSFSFSRQTYSISSSLGCSWNTRLCFQGAV